MSISAIAGEEATVVMEPHEARLEAWLAEGCELLASFRAGTQEKVSHLEQRLEILNEAVTTGAAALARANEAADTASAENTRLEARLMWAGARSAQLCDHLVERSRRNLAFLQHLDGDAATSAGMAAAGNLAEEPTIMASTREVLPPAGTAGEVIVPEEIASDVGEAANILCASGAANRTLTLADSDAEGASAIVLSVPRPLLEASERLVGAGLAESREDVLRRWLLDGWCLSGGVGTAAQPGDGLRQARRARGIDRPGDAAPPLPAEGPCSISRSIRSSDRP